MRRQDYLEILKEQTTWDIVIIGGGASGLGAAVDAASRGYKTLLLEKNDFASGTSSKSTKLIHGGLRYLEMGDFSLVKEALKERGLLLKNAPHLVHPIPFVLPVNHFFKGLYYYLGIKIYDFLSGKYKIKSSSFLSKSSIDHLNIQHKFQSGIQYFDAQFKDARLDISLMQTFIDLGGVAINYMKVDSFIKDQKMKIIGVNAFDQESKSCFSIHSKSVLNATGVNVDTIRYMDDPNFQSVITFSQGSHIVLDKSFYTSSAAIVLSETQDGRVLFVIPWQNRVLIGTTEVAINDITKKIRPLEQEINFLLEESSKILVKKPTRDDILSSFAGIRPLANVNQKNKQTSKISREYEILVSKSSLISLFGGKWTTYRLMGEKAIDVVSKTASLKFTKSLTENLKIHGYPKNMSESEWSFYGSDEKNVEALAQDDKALLIKYHPNLPLRPVDVIWAVKHEMAIKLEDVLARRSSCLLLDEKLTKEIAPKVAKLMAEILLKDASWVENELELLS